MDHQSKWKWMSLLLLSLAIGLGLGCNRSANSRSPGPRSDQPGELTLIYTTGNNGEVKDCGCPHHPLGGLARRAQYVQEVKTGGQPGGIKSSGRTVVQVDAGDGFFAFTGQNIVPSPYDQNKAKIIARSLARMGVDAVNVGMFDLLAGPEFLKKDLGEKNKLVIISSNLFDKQKQEFPFRRQIILERAGLRIGVFGLLQDVSPLSAGNLEVKDPQQAAQEMVGELRAKCDLVIGLMNLEFNTAVAVARQVPGMDIVVVSRGSRTTPQPFLADSTLVV